MKRLTVSATVLIKNRRVVCKGKRKRVRIVENEDPLYLRVFYFSDGSPPHGQENQSYSRPYSRLGYGELMFMMKGELGRFGLKYSLFLFLKVKANI
jgi:hypothetical protein